MLLRLFKSKQPIILLLIPIIAIGLWTKVLIKTTNPIFNFYFPELPLTKFFSYIFQGNIHLLTLLSLAFIILLGFLLIKLNSKFINLERTSLPALFYILIVSGSIELQLKSQVIYATFFLFLAIFQLFNSYKVERNFSFFFNAGMFIAIGCLFYSKLIFFFPVIWVGIVIIRTFNWREWATMFIGFMTPLVIAISYFYLTDDLNTYIENFSNDLFYKNIDFQLKFHDIIFYSYLFLLSIISIIKVYMGSSIGKISTRKFFMILFWSVFISVFIYFVLQTNSFEFIYFLGIPLSVFFTNYFMIGRESWMKEILFTLFIVIIIYSQIVS